MAVEIDLIEDWLNTIAYSHSNSENTKRNYRPIFNKFSVFIGKPAKQIIQEYQNSNDRQFKQLYGSYLKAWISKLQNSKYSSNTVSNHINIVKSFFKYNDLPLSYIPSGNGLVEFHNRDITSEEIVKVLNQSDHREKAFYTLMAQTGLRPDTITKLKVGDFENLLNENTPIPCLINVRQDATKGKYSEYFSFAPQESIKYLKEYLQTRKLPITEDSFIIAMHDDETKPVSPGVFSHLFRRKVLKLQKDNLLSFKTKSKNIDVKTKNDVILRRQVTRNELRLYNLRKFFRKYAGQAGPDYVNFWMGHLDALGVDLHYFSKDIEQHRQVFKTKAMPFLSLETPTPTETTKIIETLREQHQKELTVIKTEYQVKITKETEQLHNQIEDQQKQINKITDLLKRMLEGDVASIEPISNEEAFNHLQTTPENQQIDLTSNQANFKLRRKLIAKKDRNNDGNK